MVRDIFRLVQVLLLFWDPSDPFWSGCCHPVPLNTLHEMDSQERASFLLSSDTRQD